ncbi:periplasmic heavy metal sensor [Terriglobus albidus]|uniref:Periplasmic heavy metal sensor n=1 Tax=Terriglobus albidus TaxID=1592106 RepID=A0A5B9E8N3_9BACT|nr:periplasmic heavy metal sensor [Terriglobus albidus]QEE26831.1 periplasmic heavy metal sensor [Terriglobus albidus]
MTYRFQLALALLAILLGGSAALAQGPGGPGGGGMGGGRPPMGNGGGFGGGFPDRRNSPPPYSGSTPGTVSTMHGGLQVGPPGRWWDDKKFSESIGIQKEQRARMDAIVDANRGTLATLYRSLRKEEEALGPLVSAEQPDENRILSQIDRVAQARAELEKANARMLLGIRRELTLDQWHKLESHRGQQPPTE